MSRRLTPRRPVLRRLVPRRLVLRRAARVGAVAVAAAVVLAALGGHRDLLVAGPAALLRACPAWVLAAVAFECASLLAYALLQRRLLRAGGAAVRMRSVLGAVVGADAVASAVPMVGSGLGMALAYRDYRRAGVDGSAAAAVPVLSAAFSGLGFLGLVAVGALVAVGVLLGAGPVAAGLALTAGVAAVLVTGAARRGRRGGSAPRRRLAPGDSGVARLDCGPSTRVGAAVRIRSARMWSAWNRSALGRSVLGRSVLGRSVLAWPALGWPGSGWSALCGSARWGADALCLAAAIAATGAAVPWDRLLLVWAAGAAVTALGISPGGVGTADSVLLAALVGTGVSPAAAAAAVVLYRLAVLKPLPRLIWLGTRIRRRSALVDRPAVHHSGAL